MMVMTLNVIIIMLAMAATAVAFSGMVQTTTAVTAQINAQMTPVMVPTRKDMRPPCVIGAFDEAGLFLTLPHPSLNEQVEK
jgi:hypothetical protein